jgi:hypothetical protein
MTFNDGKKVDLSFCYKGKQSLMVTNNAIAVSWMPGGTAR